MYFVYRNYSIVFDSCFERFGSYATEGWANLLFGGIVAGFVTGAVWRPRRPTVKIEDAIKE